MGGPAALSPLSEPRFLDAVRQAKAKTEALVAAKL